MFMYEKKLQYPVRVSNRDVRMARNILNQYGGPDGEFSARTLYVKIHTINIEKSIVAVC